MIMVNEDALEASICQESFYEFLQRFWETIIPEDPVWNWHIKYLCDELQEVAERVFLRLPKEYDLIINISPGSTKSTICSVAFPAWCWTRDASIRTICGSYSSPLSLNLGTKSREIILSDKYRRLFPEIKLNETSKGHLVNTAAGERVATSTGGSITGIHGHFIIIDDPLNPQEAASKVKLEAANEWIDQTLMTRKVDKKVAVVVLIMQRLHQDDPTGHLLEKRDKDGIKHICLPAVKNPNVKPRKLRKKYVDGLMDPERLSKDVLKKSESELGQYGFAGQFLQKPVPAGGGMFRIAEIRVEEPPAPSKFKKLVRYWDKAGTHDGGTYTVGALLGLDTRAQFWILDIVRGQWEAAERERIIKQTARIDGVKVRIGIEQEPGSGGKESAQNSLRRLAGFNVKIDRPVGDKIYRADPFSVQVNGGNVRMKRAPWNRDFLQEMEYFPRSKYKDQIDASSAAFALLTRFKRVGGIRNVRR